MKILLIPIIFAVLLLIFAALGLTGSLDFEPTSQGGGIYKSIDGGNTFELKSVVENEESFSLDRGVNDLVFGSETDLLFASVPREGVFRTRSGAESWERIFTGEVTITAFDVNPDQVSELYVGAISNKKARIYRVDLNSREVVEVYVQPDNDPTFVSVLVNPQNPEQIYGLLSNGVLIMSFNKGEDWILGTDLDGVVAKDLYLNPNDPDTLYIVSTQSYYKSIDGGFVFEAVKPDLVAKTLAGAEITAFEINPNNSQEIYIGGTGQLIVTQDGGQTWQRRTILTPDVILPITAIEVNPSNSNILYYSAGSVLYTSRNRGSSWKTTQLPGGIQSVNTILVSMQNSDILYIGVN